MVRVEPSAATSVPCAILESKQHPKIGCYAVIGVVAGRVSWPNFLIEHRWSRVPVISTACSPTLMAPYVRMQCG
jgi:hypothetical protein